MIRRIFVAVVVAIVGFTPAFAQTKDRVSTG